MDNVTGPILAAARFRNNRVKADRSIASREGTEDLISTFFYCTGVLFAYQEEYGRDDCSSLAYVVARLTLSDACHAIDHADDTLPNDDEGEQLQPLR